MLLGVLVCFMGDLARRQGGVVMRGDDAARVDWLARADSSDCHSHFDPNARL